MKEFSDFDFINESIVSYFQNSLTKTQAEQLFTWISEDKENLAHFKEIERIWFATGLLDRKDFIAQDGFRKLQEKIEENDIRPLSRPVLNISLRTISRIAVIAVLLIVTGVVSLILLNRKESVNAERFYEAIAPKGSRSVITLSDGSRVWLNSGTTLRYRSDFGVRTREVFLEGEAYFSVSEDGKLPFKVNTSDLSVTALGTAFNVKAYNDENIIETTLEKGKVILEIVGSRKFEREQQAVLLKPNQKAIFVRKSGELSINDTRNVAVTVKKTKKPDFKPLRIKVDTLVDTRLTTSWKDSKWIFRSEKLNSLAPILERRYDIVIFFADSALYNYKFTGTLKEESLEQVLKALSLAAPIRFNVNHNQVFLYEDKSQMKGYIRQVKQQNE